VGMSIRERSKYDRFSSENGKFEKQMYSMNERVSSRDFILEKMMNSNEKLTTSALEKMLEQGQKSALMLKECFKDLLFKERPRQEESEIEGSKRESEEMGKRYKKKKSELKEKIRNMEKESIEQREKIVRLETLLQTQEGLVKEKERVMRESNEKEIEMLKRENQRGREQKEKMEKENKERLEEWKKRYKEIQKQNDDLKDKILYLEIKANQMRYWDMKTGDSVHGNKSMYDNIIYSKSTIPKIKWDTRSHMDERERK